MKIKKFKPKAQPESSILTMVRQYLRMKGWYVIRIQQGLGCHKGISDLIVIKNKRVVFVEIKTEKGKLSEYQENFKSAIENAGGEYKVVRTWEDVELWA